ncbi:MAG: RloB family protein [Clostridia bacterium]|nr:RloB family protein [Clostridia bacterium]
MSLHPLKRTDLNKSWNHGRAGTKIKMAPEYQLIITEGTATEPAYFAAVSDIVNRSFPDKIHVKVEGKGKNTLSLLNSALNSVRRNQNDIKHVWIVFDTDDFSVSDINRTADLCTKYSCEETTYHAIWSNQCIEFWYLLHFGYYQTDIHRTRYFDKLTYWLKTLGQGEYSKNRTDMFYILRPYLDIALENAERLEKVNKGRTPAESAPGTMVHHLIKHLRNYIIDK